MEDNFGYCWIGIYGEKKEEGKYERKNNVFGFF